MERTADILILGGGVVGLSISYYAAKANLGRVVIVERDRVGRGASSRNLGGIREQFSNVPTIKFMSYSVGLWENIQNELGWNVLYDQKGYLIVVRREEQMEQIRKNVALQNSLGVKSEVLSAEEVFEMVPSLSSSSGVLGASFNQRDGTVHHDAVLWGFERAARRRGVEILEGVDCKSITLSSGRATGVETSAGDFKAEKIVNATGVYSRDLAATVGINLPVKSFRREAMVTEPYKSFMRPVFWDLTYGLFLSQTLRGELLCDTRDPGREESRELEASYIFMKKFAAELLELFPGLGETRVLRQWAGHYDVTPDGSPILGESEDVENLYFSSGFSGHGLMSSPALGKLYSEMFQTDRTPEMLKPFEFSRFAKGKLILEPLVAGRKLETT